MIIERYGDFFENVTAQLKCCDEYEAKRIRNSEGLDSGLLQPCISLAFLRIKKSLKDVVKDCP